MDIVVPPLGESISEAIIARWLKRVGEQAAVDEPIAELETDKITVELRAPAEGVLERQLFPEGSTVKIGQVVGQLQPGAGHKASKPALPTSPEPSLTPAVGTSEAPPKAPYVPAGTGSLPSPAPVIAAPHVELPEPTASDALPLLAGRPLPPSVRKQLREHPAVAGNGNGVRLAVAPAPAPAAPVVAGARERVVQMSPLRKRIAERLVQAQHSAAALTTFNEVDMSAVMALREKYKDTFVKKHGTKLGFMSFFVKACVEALKDFPGLNAEVREGAIVYKEHYDLGIAVSTQKGLVVPVLRDCDRLSFADVEKAVVDYGQKARDNKLTLEDLTGGTFSITNGGVFGSMLSTPLLNFPQTGILGMHNIVKRAVVVGDKVEVRPVMYLALTYDHRVVDGREAVSFLVGVKERIEAPERLLFSL